MLLHIIEKAFFFRFSQRKYERPINTHAALARGRVSAQEAARVYVPHRTPKRLKNEDLKNFPGYTEKPFC